MKKLLFALVITLISINCFAEKNTLELNLEKNKVYTQDSRTNMNMKMNMMGQEFNIVMSVGGHMSFKVKDIIDTVYNFEVCYDSLFSKMSIMGRDMDFSSEKMSDANDVMSRMMNTMKNKKFGLKMSKKGRILELNDMDSIFSEFYKMDGLTQEQKTQLKSQVEQNFGKDNLESSMSQICTIFPDKPVEIGDKWTIPGKIVTTLKASTNTVYELLEVAKDYYLLSSNSQILTDSTTSMNMNLQGAKVKLNISGNVISKIKIDKTTGWIIESKGKQDMVAKGELEGALNGQTPEGLTMDIKLSGDFTMKP